MQPQTTKSARGARRPTSNIWLQTPPRCIRKALSKQLDWILDFLNMYGTKYLFLQVPGRIQDAPKRPQDPSWWLRNASGQPKDDFKRMQDVFERCCRRIYGGTMIFQTCMMQNQWFCALQASSKTLQSASKIPHAAFETLQDRLNTTSSPSKMHSI